MKNTKKDWLITPTNEGQELNYIEGFYGTRKQVEKRALEMMTGLISVLKQATISVQFEDAEEEGVYFYSQLKDEFEKE